MKITQDTLRKIIREELEAMKDDLDPEFRKNVRGALPRDQLFKLISKAGLIMHDVNREEFFQWLDKRGFTTKDAVEDNRGLIAGWLKKSRADWVRKNR